MLAPRFVAGALRQTPRASAALLSATPSKALSTTSSIGRTRVSPFARSRSRSNVQPSGLRPLLAPRAWASTSSTVPATKANTPATPTEERDTPAYEITFTCKPCLKRSTHRISKQGYHRGSVLITCPKCKNRHVIADHLKIFSDTRFSIEDVLREKGGQFQKGTISADGDVEFWDDGTSTPREGASESEVKKL